MSNKDIDTITAKLEALEVQQAKETTSLQNKHQLQQRNLFKSLKRSPVKKKEPQPKQPVLSYSRFPLHCGDQVFIRSKALIGQKGDLATVLHVDKNRINIYVPRLNNATCCIPQNLTHHLSDHSY